MSGAEAGRQRQALAAADHQDSTGKPDDDAEHMLPFELLARQESGEGDEEQRPQIGDEAHLDRRRRADRGEINEMIAEQAADPQGPDAPVARHPRKHARPERPGREPDQPADQEGHGGELERRHAARRRREGGQHRPHDDGREPDECRGGAGQAILEK